MANQVFMFQGVEEQLTETVTNAYFGQTASLNGIYNVNTGTYIGTGTGNTLLMTNATDAMFVLNSSNQATIGGIQRIVTGNGDDFLDLASTQVNLGNITIFGGTGNQTIWDNSGNDTINAGNGTNNIVGGTGNDIINGGTGADTIYVGSGNNTVSSGGGDDELIYNVTQNLGSTDTFNGGTGTDTLTLMMTAAQANADATDITGALAFVAINYNPASSTGPSYTFASLGLTISNVEVINIVITSNSSPVAHEDDFSSQQGQVVQGNLLANNGHGTASDPDGDTVTAVAGTLTTAQGGAVVINANGTFTYTPTASFFGTDTFNYTVSDGRGATATAAAVISLNGQPVAQEDDFSSQQGQVVAGNLLANNGHGAASDPDGDTLSTVASTLTTAHGGTAVINTDGTFTYSPTSGFFGSDTFSYTVSDGQGGSATGTAVVSINATPVVQLENFSGQENQTVSGNLMTSASDPDGDALTAVAGTIATSHGGSVALNANGTFSYTPAAGFFGVDSFDWTVSDGHGGITTGAVSIAVNAPPVAQEDDFRGQENQAVTGNLLADNGHGTASDPDGDTLSTVATTLTAAHGGTAVLNADGTFTYNPASGFFGSDTFSYTVLDGQGGTATGTALVSVNAPPVVQPDNFLGQENQAVSGNLLPSASDPDGDTLAAVAGTIATAHGGTVVLNATGTFTYTPASGFFGADSFDWTVSDGQGGTAVGAVSIAVNAPPVAQEDDFSGQKNQAITGNVFTDNGHGVDTDPDGDPLSVTATTLTTAHGGNVALNADGTFTYSPASNFFGADTFAYTLMDGQGGTATGTVNLTINNTNQPPVALPDSISGTTDDTVTGNVLADNGHGADSDPNGLPLSVQAATFSTATGGHVVLNADGTFTYNAIAGFVGTDAFNYNVTDGVASASSTVTLTITPAAGMIVGTNGNDFINLYDRDHRGDDDHRREREDHQGDDRSHSQGFTILGLGGNDIIIGGEGNDHIYGGAGNDVIYGGNGNDVITGGPGRDIILGGDGNDILVAGDAVIIYSAGHDPVVTPVVTAGDSGNILYGGDGNDVLYAGSGGKDILYGGEGADRFVFSFLTAAPDMVKDFNARAGDKLDFSALIQVTNPLQAHIDQFIHATTQGRNTTLSVDLDGPANGSHFTPVVTLEGVQHFDVVAAVANGSLIA